jgi:hypothetical protein
MPISAIARCNLHPQCYTNLALDNSYVVTGPRRATDFPVDLFVAIRGGYLCKVEVPLSASTCCMGKNRLEAFSDGVLAILITIMVLEIKVPCTI